MVTSTLKWDCAAYINKFWLVSLVQPSGPPLPSGSPRNHPVLGDISKKTGRLPLTSTRWTRRLSQAAWASVLSFITAAFQMTTSLPTTSNPPQQSPNSTRPGSKVMSSSSCSPLDVLPPDRQVLCKREEQMGGIMLEIKGVPQSNRRYKSMMHLSDL